MTVEMLQVPVDFLMEVEKSVEQKGGWIVEGHVATNDYDLQEDVIAERAVKASEDDLLENSTVLYNHDLKSPIGRVLETKVKKGKLWVKVLISKTVPDIWTKIQEGVLNKFSVRARILKASKRFMAQLGRVVNYIEKMYLIECSMVSVPANVKARALNFYVSKALRKIEEGGENMSGTDETILEDEDQVTDDETEKSEETEREEIEKADGEEVEVEEPAKKPAEEEEATSKQDQKAAIKKAVGVLDQIIARAGAGIQALAKQAKSILMGATGEKYPEPAKSSSPVEDPATAKVGGDLTEEKVRAIFMECIASMTETKKSVDGDKDDEDEKSEKSDDADKGDKDEADEEKGSEDGDDSEKKEDDGDAKEKTKSADDRMSDIEKKLDVICKATGGSQLLEDATKEEEDIGFPMPPGTPKS